MRQASPVITILDAKMALVATEQLIWTLTNQRHLDVLASSLRDEVHGDDRGGRNRLLEPLNDPR